jgi:transcriptional regulator with GAF, ATPase, and Fis domain
MTAGSSPVELAELFDAVARELSAAPDNKAALSLVADVAVRHVDGADYAGITVGKDGEQFETVAATADIVRRCDQIQYDLRHGPCVDAVVAEPCYNAADLRVDERWPEFARRCVEQTGIVSMLSMRLFIESDADLIAGLNMYSHQPRAFNENSETVAHLLATHGALAVGKASAEDKSRNLMRALQTSREIGMAMGIVMNSYKVTREQAFDLLCIASQRSHRKLAEIASQVTETGALPGA